MKAKFEESHTNNVFFWRYDCDSFLPSFLIQFVSHAYFEINIYWINNRRKIKLFSLSFKGSDTSGIILLKQYGKLILGETTITYIQLVKLLQHFTKGSITPAPHTYTFPCPSQPSSPFLSQLSFWNKTYDPSAPVHKLLALHSMVPAKLGGSSLVTSPPPTSILFFPFPTGAKDFSLPRYLTPNCHVSGPLPM